MLSIDYIGPYCLPKVPGNDTERCGLWCPLRQVIPRSRTLLCTQVVLKPCRAELERRLSARWRDQSHFMAPSLLDSQLRTLEVNTLISLYLRDNAQMWYSLVVVTVPSFSFSFS